MLHKTPLAIACLGIAASSAGAQLITAYTGDEGGDRSWFIDVETGDDEGGVLGGFNALATDPTTNRIFGSTGRNLVVYNVINGEAEQNDSPRLVVDENGDRVISIRSFAFGNGELYAYHTGLGDAPGGIYRIHVDVRIPTDTFPLVPATLVTPLQDLPLPQPIDFVAEGNVAGLTYDTDRNEFLIGVKKYEEQDGVDDGDPGPADEFENFIGNDIFEFDPETGQASLVVEIPFSLGEGGFDGMAYGRDRIFLDCGAPCGDISIYNRATGQFEQQIAAPNRFGNGAGGAAFLEAVAPSVPQRRVQVRSVDFAAGLIEVFNFGDSDVQLDGWRFCSHDFDQDRRYSAAGGLDGVKLEAGTSVVVHFNNDAPSGDPDRINRSDIGGAFAEPLDTDAYAIQIFFPDQNGSVSFGNSSLIADHVQWNIDGQSAGAAETRTQQAVDEGLWSAIGAFIATENGSVSISLNDISGDAFGAPSEYVVAEPICRGDATGDGRIDLIDLLVVLDNFGLSTSAGAEAGDIAPAGAPDGVVDLNDLLLVLDTFGGICD